MILTALALGLVVSGETVEFVRDVLPVFQRACTKCHSEAKSKAGLRLDTGVGVRNGGVSGRAVVPGHSTTSYLLKRLRGEGGEDRMPSEEQPLTEREIELVARWIDAGATVPKEADVPFAPAAGGMRRLTSSQYRNAIQDLLGVPATLALEADDKAATRFAPVAAYKVSTSPMGVEKYLEAALTTPKVVFADAGKREELVGCSPVGAKDPCVARFLARFGRRAWRRPVAAAELSLYIRLVTRVAAANTGDVWKGIQLAVSAFLQSPNFLYASETGDSDPARPGWRRFTGYEVGTRLSLLIWDGLPDFELLDAAATGRLSTAAGVRSEANRMLASPRARLGVRRFFSEHLDLDELEHLGKSKMEFPQATKALAVAMSEEITRVLDHLVFAKDGDVMDFLTTRETFVDRELARLYGLADPGEGFSKVTLPEEGDRAGFLGTGAFLAVNAGTTRTSPTRRGVFIRERLLCQEVPPPPANVNTDLEEAEEKAKLKANQTGKAYQRAETRTMRERLSAHANNPTCANCHAFFDPLGLALEQFDGVGAHRTTDGGKAIDLSATIDGTAFTGARALGDLLRKDPRAAACLVRETYQYAVGHAPTRGETAVMKDLVGKFEASGHNFKRLLVDVVTSEGFRYFEGKGQ